MWYWPEQEARTRHAELIAWAEHERLVDAASAAAELTQPGLRRRALARLGGWLVHEGTRLQSDYTQGMQQ